MTDEDSAKVVVDSALAPALQVIGRASLADIPPWVAARVMRRIVDGDAGQRLDVAAFNSAT